MNENDINRVKELLSSPKKIAIIAHRNPDGDAIGSALALYHFLIKEKHAPTVISPNDFPAFLSWLPASETILVYEKNKITVTKVLEESELIIVVDFNALHRVGEMENVLNTIEVPFIMIDHHLSPDDFAVVKYSDIKYSSTCEMVYNFICHIGKKNIIDKTIGTCIYTGILTDTGQFRFERTTANTHRIVAEMIDLGVENWTIPIMLFDNSTESKLKILGKALQNMKIIGEHKTSYSSLSQKELDECGNKKGDTEGVVNYGLSIKGILFTALFTENKEEGIVKISFRSQEDFDVNIFARNYFDGGGHKNAAGGKSVETLEKTVQRFEELLKTIEI